MESIEGLVYEDAPDPQPAIGDALVEVRAAGFAPTELTWPLRTDRAGHDRGPLIPAHEGSGVVGALGYGTAGIGGRRGLRPDRQVPRRVGCRVRDDRGSQLGAQPTTVDFIEAAAIRQAGLTSWQALFDHGRLESGQTVVIHGAGGGVGSMAVQMARWAGAHVIGTGRAGARQRVLELGADDFLEVDRDGWETAIGQVDLVYDAIGGDVLAQSEAIVKPGGALVSVWRHRKPTGTTSAQFPSYATPSGFQLRDITRLVDQGKLRPQIGAVYPLADAREAFMAKSTRHIPGKVVLTP